MKVRIYDAGTHGNLASGYGQLAVNLASQLDALGYDVYVDNVPGVSTGLEHKDFVHTDDTVYLWIRPPHYIKYDDFNDKYRNVFFTMHESETFSGWKSDWPDLLNKVRHIFVPTKWNASVFLSAGVKTPMTVVPLGVNTNTFSPCLENGFAILAVHEALGSLQSRENWQMTVEAFSELFAGRNAYLTIKTWNYKETTFREFPKSGDIRVLYTTLLPRGMADLYRAHHLFIKNSNREGWSLPMTEAMASYLPVLAYDNPVLRENSDGYPRITFFTKKDELKYWMDKAWHEWRDRRVILDSFSWKRTARIVDSVLKTL